MNKNSRDEKDQRYNEIGTTLGSILGVSAGITAGIMGRQDYLVEATVAGMLVGKAIGVGMSLIDRAYCVDWSDIRERYEQIKEKIISFE